MNQFFRIAVAVLACLSGAGASFGQESTNNGAAVYLHAWMPETGPLPREATAPESDLILAAEMARHGDFEGAQQQLERIGRTYAEARTRYLALLFRRELNRRRMLYPGEAIALQHDLQLMHMMLSVQADQELRVAMQLATQLGETGQRDFQTIGTITRIQMECLGFIPTLGYAAIEPATQKKLEEFVQGIRSGCEQRIGSLRPAGIGEASILALRTLAGARYAAIVQNDIEAARSLLLSGLQHAQKNGWNEAVALWELRLGDLDAAPRGNVLSLGFELPAEVHVRSDAIVASRSAGTEIGHQLYEDQHVSAGSAAAWYAKARQSDRRYGAIRASEFALRDAFLQYRRGEPAVGGYLKAAALAREESASWIEVMAAGCAALLGASTAPVGKALDSALEHGNFGAATSLAEMAKSWANRAEARGMALAAADRLRPFAFEFAGRNLDTTRAGLLLNLAALESGMDRAEAAVYYTDEAVAEGRQILERFVIASRASVPNAEPHQRVEESELKRTLAHFLLSLAQHLLSLRISDGHIAWSSRHDEVMNEVRAIAATLGPQGSGIPEDFDFSTLTESGGQLAEFRKRATCGEAMRSFAKSQKSGKPKNAFLSVQEMVIAGGCDPKWLERAREALAAIHPVKPVADALAASREPWNTAARLELQRRLNEFEEWLLIADLADAGETMSLWIQEAERTLASTPPFAQLSPVLKLRRARVLAIANKPAEALDLLLRTQKDEPLWQSESDRAYRSDVLKLLVEIYVKLGRAEDALFAAEQERAERVRVRQLATGIRADDLRSAEAAMLMRAAAMGEPFDRKRLSELHSRASFPEPLWLPTIKDLRAGVQNLPPNTVGLVYHPLRDAVAVWRVERGTEPRLIRIPVLPEQLVRMARLLRSKLAGAEADWQPLARDLYSHLIAPVGSIPDKHTVAIVGADRIGGIPFEILGVTDTSRLFRTNPVVYAGSMIDRTSRTAEKSSRRSALAVGLDTSDMKGLEREAAAAVSALRGSTLTGAAATVASVREKLASASVVHLATHGVLDPQNSYRSFLMLSDGRLESWQLFGDAAGADLLVLSACDTQAGARRPLEIAASDVDSITGVASRAGVQRIIASLWKAENQTTQILMAAFYEELAADRSHPAKALQRAKLKLSPLVEHPADYANFVMSVRSPSAIMIP